MPSSIQERIMRNCPRRSNRANKLSDGQLAVTSHVGFCKRVDCPNERCKSDAQDVEEEWENGKRMAWQALQQAAGRSSLIPAQRHPSVQPRTSVQTHTPSQEHAAAQTRASVQTQAPADIQTPAHIQIPAQTNAPAQRQKQKQKQKQKRDGRGKKRGCAIM